FINTSQRSSETAAFASSFSFPPKELLLGVVPFLLGGSKLFSQPIYFGQSNLPEVTMYVGILPLIALGALFSKRWRDRLPRGERRACLTIAVVGLLLAIGAGTPLGHVIALVPVYGKQRNQGRNIVDVDFAACCALAWWIDGSRAAERLRSRSRAETVTVGILAVTVAAVLVAFTFFRGTFWSWMNAAAQPSITLGSLYLAIGVSGLLVVGAGAVSWLGPRLTGRRWRQLVTGFLALDLVLFWGGSYLWSSEPLPTSANPGPVFGVVSRNLPAGGRYGLFNPDLFFARGLIESSEPDLGIMVGDASAEGYSAVQNAGYVADTGTHLRNSLSAIDLRKGIFEQLDLDVMVAPAEYFLVPESRAPAASNRLSLLSQGPGTDPLLPGGNVPLKGAGLPPLNLAGDDADLAQGATTGWFFGRPLAPTIVNVSLLQPASNQVVRVAAVAADGRLTWGGPRRLTGTNTAISLPGTAAVGLELELVSGSGLSKFYVSAGQDGHEFLLDGPLAHAVTPLNFAQVGFVDELAVFRARTTPPAAWWQPAGTEGRLDGVSQLSTGVRILSETPDSATVEVEAPQAGLLTRSVAFDDGWYASVVSGSANTVAAAASSASGGRQLPGGHRLGVVRVGVVQGVPVPAGWSVVQFHYRPKGIGKGELVTGLTGVVLVMAAGWWLVDRRRRRGRPPRPGSQGGTVRAAGG
ncbi:MAG TPA: hypothetical protein VGP46_02770, partial [Acidimicrobiales bacterium]|nr:hypothetical protein [Acidimicrobiales bacterium]